MFLKHTPKERGGRHEKYPPRHSPETPSAARTGGHSKSEFPPKLLKAPKVDMIGQPPCAGRPYSRKFGGVGTWLKSGHLWPTSARCAELAPARDFRAMPERICNSRPTAQAAEGKPAGIPRLLSCQGGRSQAGHVHHEPRRSKFACNGNTTSAGKSPGPSGTAQHKRQAWYNETSAALPVPCV